MSSQETTQDWLNASKRILERKSIRRLYQDETARQARFNGEGRHLFYSVWYWSAFSTHDGVWKRSLDTGTIIQSGKARYRVHYDGSLRRLPDVE